MNENLYLYILMRNDLPSMGCGRAAAQASHASNAFIHKFGENEDVIRWQDQTPQGFGTAIVLSCNFAEITETMDMCHNEAIVDIRDYVTDPDYVVPISAELVPFLNMEDTRIKVEQSQTDPNKYLVHRSEITCAYVFGDKERLAPILSRFPLYS